MKSSVLYFLRDTSINGRPKYYSKKEVLSELFVRRIGCFKETELPCQEWKFDKAFSATWIDNDEIAVATKCGCLLRIGAETGLIQQVVSPGLPQVYQAMRHPPPGNPGGIHSIALSPSGNYLATGAADSTVCSVLHAKTFAAVQHFKAHHDWIFGLDWVTDVHLVTGSRDRSVRLWKVDGDRGDVVHEALYSRSVHKEKVRDVKYSPEPNRIISFSTDGDVRVWDPLDLRGILSQSLHRDHSHELACLAVQGYQAAVGTRDYVILMDIRTKRAYTEVQLLTPDYSVRSLQFQDQLLSCGSGNGWLSFFDMRAMDFVEMEISQDRGKKVLVDNHIEVGCGWLDTEGFYREYFEGVAVHNALYAHCWDPGLHRLFICGGPLPMGLRGCYMGIWQ